MLWLISDACLGLGCGHVNTWVITFVIPDVLCWLSTLFGTGHWSRCFGKKKSVLCELEDLTSRGLPKSSSLIFFKLSKGPFWSIVVMWSWNSNMNTLVLAAPSSGSPGHSHRALIIHTFLCIAPKSSPCPRRGCFRCQDGHYLFIPRLLTAAIWSQSLKLFWRDVYISWLSSLAHISICRCPGIH